MTASIDLNDQSALLCGNGKYANQVYDELVKGRSWKAVSLIDEPSAQGMNFLMKGGMYQPIPMLQLLRRVRVTRVVLAGDLDYAARVDADMLRKAIFSSYRHIPMVVELGLRRKFDAKFNLAIWALRRLESLLMRWGITPVHAGTLMPDLRVPLGPMNLPAQAYSDALIKQIVSRALPAIGEQSHHQVRQAAVMDGLDIVNLERSSTRELLSEMAARPPAAGVVRTLVKLTPPAVPPQLDPPVIGESTIEEARDAHVNLIIFDHRHGIIARRQHTIDKANEAGIALFGYDTA